ncbi:acyl-CoA dehydrogenase family protein [Amycolatopsis pithecellobii]|uniref:Acyl-CoA dehydrogenase n=1 Tax=Amycolatopsis pithecellobii TaxID=664692 RepID=A0A6N7YR13_9PSEU|nr:acyl-CoA dehydrogenase family protein [Amycolatopsis pithecellobii]MTD55455.1 acyl-CoA dehydrogenase [Amycolatopsis pithecellobii]
MFEEFTEVQRDVIEQSRKLAARFPLDYWSHCDSSHEYPWEFINAFADAGWMGIVVPEEYGGLGLGIKEAALLMKEIAASGAGTSGAAAMHFYVFPPSPILRHGSAEMRSRYMPTIARGEMVMAFGITEPNAGSDTSRTATRAVRSADKWIINGQKVWTTNAQNATHMILLARTSPRDEERPFDGLTLFFLEIDRSRVDIRVIEKLGRSAVDSNEVFIKDLVATDDDVIGEVGKGFRYLLDGLNPERIVIAMEAIGMGHAALRLGVDYSKSRTVFDRPIAANQAIAHPMAENWARLTAAETVALKAADYYDNGLPCGPLANTAKFLGADAGFSACDAVLQVHGGFGYAKEYHIERLWRESRLYRIAPISQEMVLNYLSEHVLTLPKSY